jgi:hypothetical protein
VRLDLHAPIVPGRGLGGLELRARILDLQPYFLGLGVTRQGAYALISPFDASYRLGCSAVEVVVDVRNGKVSRLTAHGGYRGRVLGDVAVGDNLGAALARHPHLFYDEGEALVLSRDVEGLSMDVEADDPPPGAVAGMAIHAISVYAPEIMTTAGQEGRW